MGLKGWDLGLKAGIWALRLVLSLERGWGRTEKKEKKEKEEKFPLCVKV